MNNSRCRSKIAGSSLVEVMIALFVLAVGLLGILAMQVQSVQLNQSAHLYSRAAILASDLAEAIQISGIPKATFAGFADNAHGPEAGCEHETECTPAQIALWSFGRWRDRVTQTLPGGDGSVELVTGEYQIVVSFQSSEDSGTGVSEHRVALAIGS